MKKGGMFLLNSRIRQLLIVSGVVVALMLAIIIAPYFMVGEGSKVSLVEKAFAYISIWNPAPPSGGSGGGATSTQTTPTIKINNGVSKTSSKNVQLSFSVSNVTLMAISNTADFAGISYEAYTATKAWTLTAGNGAKTVYTKFRSSAGGVSNVISASIALEENADAITITTPALTAEVTAAEVADGDIVNNSHAAGIAQFDVYITKRISNKKFKRLILSPHVFSSYGHLSWSKLKKTNTTNIDEFTISNLVRAEGDPKVYKLVPNGDTGIKQWLNITAGEFTAAGYDWDSIFMINTTDRDAYTTGVAIIKI